MSKTVYQNEVITHTVVTGDLLSGATVGTLQEGYPLREANYLREKCFQTAIDDKRHVV